MDDETKELLPCPFCGGKAILHVDNGVKVMCTKCFSSTRKLSDGFIGGKFTGNAIDSVIKKWNARI